MYVDKPMVPSHAKMCVTVDKLEKVTYVICTTSQGRQEYGQWAEIHLGSI